MANPPVSTSEPRSPALMFNAYVEFMKVALSNVFLINAGSATAIIAFLGSSRDRPQNAPNTPTAVAESFLANGGAAWAVKCFAIGAFCAIVGTALLAAQENWNSDRREKGERLVVYLGIVVVVAFLVSGRAFLAGCLGAVK